MASKRAAAWLDQAAAAASPSSDLKLDDLSFSTPRAARVPTVPLPSSSRPRPVLHHRTPPSPSPKQAPDDPFETSWRLNSTTVVALPPPTSPSPLYSSPSPRRPPPTIKSSSVTESVQKKAERFLASAGAGSTTLVPSSTAIALPTCTTVMSSATRVLLRWQSTGEYLADTEEEEDGNAGGFMLHECEVVLDKHHQHQSASSSGVRYGDVVVIRFATNPPTKPRFVGTEGGSALLVVSSREQAASWFVRHEEEEDSQSVWVEFNSAVRLENTRSGSLLALSGVGNSSSVWNVVRSNGAATCYLAPPVLLLDLLLGLAPAAAASSTSPLAAEEDALNLVRHVDSLRQHCATAASSPSQVGQALAHYLQERVLDPFCEFVAGLYSADSSSLPLVINLVLPRGRLLVDWSRLVRGMQASGVLRTSGGGAVLNALHDARLWAFESPQQCEDALKACAAPYLAMLHAWVERGELGKATDPYGEFLVVEDEAKSSAVQLGSDVNCLYWSHRFRLVQQHGTEQHIPWFLQPVAESVLRCGRNWRALRDAGLAAAAARGGALPTDDMQQQAGVVKRLLQESHRALLHELHSTCRLPHVLRGLKRFFLMEQGDFFSHLLDVASTELHTTRGMDGGRLEALLPVLLRDTLRGKDEDEDALLLDYLTCTLVREPIDVHVDRIQTGTADYAASTADDLLCVDVLALDLHRVPFPLTLVLNKRCVAKYQLLFRHLFRCKYCERALGQVWCLLREQPQEHILAASLLQRMTQFLQSFAYYVAFEVIEPRWRAFWDGSVVVAGEHHQDGVDVLLRAHEEDFLDSCLKECLLTHPKLIRQFSRLLELCSDFAARFLDKQQEQHSLMAVVVDVSAARVVEFDDEFRTFLSLLHEEANSTTSSAKAQQHLLHLASRLDYSDFYV